MFFGVLFLFLAIFFGLSVWYISSRIRKYEKIKSLGTKGKVLSWILPVAVVALVLVLLNISFFNSIIIVLHLLAAIKLCDLVGYIVKKIAKKPHKRVFEDVCALVITVVYLGVGWFLGHHVFETRYTFDTDKDLGQETFRVVQISDSHLGVTLSGEDFAEEMERVQATNPDIVVITGDFVDDDSSREDMVTACEALGRLKTSSGVYFVFGNHDEGYFDTRNFTADELCANLILNGVEILEDETVLINGSIYLIGRNDRSMRDRADMSELVADLDKSKYMLVLDHQPNDYAAEAEANVDLVLSGHTHGGHIWPAGIFGVLMGSNDRAYGTETRGNTNFVVSSGISGWAIPFKTGTISEFVVIDIK